MTLINGITYLKDGRIQKRTKLLDRMEAEGVDVVSIYLENGTIIKAAIKLGVGEHTLQRWLDGRAVPGIPEWKIKWLKKYYGKERTGIVAKKLNIHRCTVNEYFKKFEQLKK
jgi:transposase